MQQHASPAWLGRQHLDILLPEIGVAIEYQGRQHDEPIDFFGGAAAFEATVRRDAKKRALCNQNGITLIEVRPSDELEDVIEKIQRAISAAG